jgi:hypothetical protein
MCRLSISFVLLGWLGWKLRTDEEVAWSVMQQLELFAFDQIGPAELCRIHTAIRNAYWHIRNLRGGKFGQARLRRAYRLVEVEKNACC